MTDEKNVMARAIPWDLHRLPDFDYSKFIRVADTGDGKKDVVMSMEGRKTWFRLACPSGALVLNALRVADTMAIFEARVFADANDRNPLASFTATQKADKGTGEAYIRAAQDTALEGALKSAGFCLQISVLADVAKGGRTAAQPSPADNAGQSAEAAKAQPIPLQQADAPEQKAGNDVPPPVEKTAQQPDVAPRPDPVSPQPHAPQPDAAPAPVSQNAAPVVDINTRQPVAADTNAVVTPPAPAPAPTPAPEAPAEQAGPAPVTYTADMTVEEITGRMTLEQARAIKVQEGTCKGWTLEQVAKDRPPSLKWLKFAAPFADNVLKAAAAIVLNDLELKQAG